MAGRGPTTPITFDDDETELPCPNPTSQVFPGQHAAPEGPVDLINMYVMHHAFRRDLIAFRTAVERAPIGDRARWRALHQRWPIFASALHHHHAAEDAGLWPLLLSRTTAAGDDTAAEVLDAMQAEHARIDPLLDACTSLNRTISAASQPQRDELIVMAQRRGLL